MPITANFVPAAFRLDVLGTFAGETITLARDAAGVLNVNNGAVPVTGGTASVANTDLITVAGDAGQDIITLSETLGALPAAQLSGGLGDDTLTGGSGGDTLAGDTGNDALLGKGGNDQLFGGTENDTLTGGDGEDQMFGQDGDDRMIWNPGDDSDLMEGGAGDDIAEVNGGGGDEVFTVTANGTRVRFDRLSPAPFLLDIGTTESLVLNAGGGNDSISTTGNLALLISLTLDGGAGHDTILGSNGIDILLGGDGNDFVDGQQGNDTAFLGAGNDVFQWDPGEGSDTIEGQADADTLLFNGSAGNEIFVMSANGGRVMFTRNLGSIVMDANDVEAFTINALGGTDTFTVNDLSGTDATAIALNLSGTIGGTAGDAQADTLTVNGTNAANMIDVTGSGTGFSVTGLTASIAVTNSEGANDQAVINALGGDDSITATTLAAGVVKLTIDGGTGNDTILASLGADTILGGDGNDFVFGDNGNDTALLGAGNDVFEWAPGDGSDVVEGQADLDELRFVGSNVNETINIAPNGGRILFFRDVAAVTMDLDDVEKIRFDALGGADNIVVGDLSGTDATNVELRLAASGGGGDGAVDTVTVNGSGVADALAASSAGGIVSVTGLPWTVAITGAEGANDRLTLNGLGDDDVINASALAAGLVSLTVNGGLGDDFVVGSAGADFVNGGDGDDTALLGAGNDVFTWNPGDDNDTIEGQTGTDTLRFNGANTGEQITISANGGRVLFLRDIANVVMDLNDTEVIQYMALGGADTITVNDLSGTDVTQIAIDLAVPAGGAAGDAAVDTLILNASDTASTITLSGTSGALLTVTGLPASVALSQFETSSGGDRLTILALGGNDNISATGLLPHFATLTIDGGAGNDVIRSNGEGTYLGGIGDDMIFAGLSGTLEIEALDGGTGTDTLDTTTWGGLYTINLVTGLTSFTGEAFSNFENLTSGAGNDTVTGTDAANVIRTNGGVDNISAAGGNDSLDGGSGADTMAGGAGDDFFYVDDFGDVVIEGAAEGSNDRIFASTSYVLAAGVRVEKLTTTNNAGTDPINLSGNEIANIIFGNAGVNGLDGRGGADTMVGLAGDDWYWVDSAADAIVEGAAEGAADRALTGVSYTLGAGVFVELLSTDNDVGFVAINLTGNALVNGLRGNAGANSLDGKAGADTMTGLGGDDFYYVDNAGDLVVEGVGEGANDRIFASVSYTLGAGVQIEKMSTTNNAGTGAINLTGNALVNVIFGNAGSNTLDGKAGADTLVGLGGDDFYYVDNAADAVVEGAADGAIDRLYASVSYTLGAGVYVERMATTNNAGIIGIALTGNELANIIYGNAGNNILDGGAGVDVLAGLGGNDWYYVDNAGDGISETIGNGDDRVFASVSYTLGAGHHVEMLTTSNNAGTGAINLTGNELANTIYGNAGDNILDGKGGADTLVGLAGADSFAFTTALGAGNVDSISGFSVADDTIRLENAVFTGLAAGVLAAGAFNTGAAATQADDRILYNSATGALLFDADGVGGAAAVQFATLATGLGITAGDFVVI